LATASSQTFSRVAAASRSRLNSAAAAATREEPESAENLCHLGKGLQSAVERSACAGAVLARPEVG
jgi:hypothetical protein